MDKSTEAPLSGFSSDRDATTSPPPYTNAASSSTPRPSQHLSLTQETRSNFYIKSEHGDVTLELYLLDKPIVGGRKKVLLNASSTYKSTSVHIHRDGPSPPFILHSHSTTTSKAENITVRIPRSFKGTITAGSIHGPVSMSPAISRRAYLFNDALVLNNHHGCARISFEDEDFAVKLDEVVTKPAKKPTAKNPTAKKPTVKKPTVKKAYCEKAYCKA
ncbi:hypothetical protein BDP27DRAFT_1418195 [Rhodocollybia butyracea]|uniref:DUF7330 domain-containing protein n=1 Tax=Rhodocollybia butyracea TaxID=206335 RepID=A0A9P5PTW2_9AGAR|nr:hypothetical protein BDP27DRAFT_1418195 [Rhodocollybia butyracea]